MATNKYFNLYHQKQEQTLLQSLIEESIKIHGIDAVYIPRKNEQIDPIFREDVLAQFKDYYHMEVYIKNVDGFEGDGELFSKFGLQIKNQITFSIARSTFAKVAGRELIRPNEGDLIYIPLSISNCLYEIRYVTNKSVFYNLGEFYMYDVKCEQYAFQDENVKTGIDSIDNIGNGGSQNITVFLGAGGGAFVVGEVAYQGESVIGADAKGIVTKVHADGSIEVKDVYGEFKPSLGFIRGERSQSQYIVRPSPTSTVQISNDFGAQNSNIPADSTIDFTENNPFSEEDY